MHWDSLRTRIDQLGGVVWSQRHWIRTPVPVRRSIATSGALTRSGPQSENRSHEGFTRDPLTDTLWVHAAGLMLHVSPDGRVRRPGHPPRHAHRSGRLVARSLLRPDRGHQPLELAA